MKKEIIQTLDGIPTLFIAELNETYHSRNGVLNEAKHVFIENGLNKIQKEEINILEIGFGTGFNTLLTFFEAQKKNISINYFGIEKFPLEKELILKLNYQNIFYDKTLAKSILEALHEQNNDLLNLYNFNFNLLKNDFFDLKNINLPKIDLVYFDAFGSRVQPELWEKPLFEIIHNKMNVRGLLTTYSSKGTARRFLQEIGFMVEKIPGPKGKREMINAWKIN